MSRKYFDKVLRGSLHSSTPFKSECGLNILKNLGWKEGEGLGPKRDGRNEAIQIDFREKNAGLGTEKEKSGVDDWNNWWCDGFNKAAQRMNSATSMNDSVQSADILSSGSESESESENLISDGGRVSCIKGASRQAGKLRRIMRANSAATSTGASTPPPKKAKKVVESDSSDSESENEEAAAEAKKRLEEAKKRLAALRAAADSDSDEDSDSDSDDEKAEEVEKVSKKRKAEVAAEETVSKKSKKEESSDDDSSDSDSD